MDVFFREAIRERLRKLSLMPGLKRREHLHAYVFKTHQKLVQKNIEKLKMRRSELLYCSKRARPVPLHKQLQIF